MLEQYLLLKDKLTTGAAIFLFLQTYLLIPAKRSSAQHSRIYR